MLEKNAPNVYCLCVCAKPTHSPDGTYNCKVLFRLEDFISLFSFMLRLFPFMVGIDTHTHTSCIGEIQRTKDSLYSIANCSHWWLSHMVLKFQRWTKWKKTYKKKRHFTSGQTLCFESNEKKNSAQTTHYHTYSSLHWDGSVCVCVYFARFAITLAGEYTSTHYSGSVFDIKKMYLHSQL